MPSTRPLAIITGASSGIGYEFARIFAKNDHDLLITARSEHKLHEKALHLEKEFHVSVTYVTADLSRPGAPDKIFRAAQKRNKSTSILINNAGFGEYGPFAHLNLLNQLDMIRVNVLSVTSLTRLFLPDMVSNNSGKILNVASTAAYFPGPSRAVYFATKAFVLSLSESLASELDNTNITISALCPGRTRTNFFNKDNPAPRSSVLSRVMTPESVARIGYDGLMSGKKIIIPGPFNYLSVLATRFLPRSLLATLSKNAMKP